MNIFWLFAGAVVFWICICISIAILDAAFTRAALAKVTK